MQWKWRAGWNPCTQSYYAQRTSTKSDLIGADRTVYMHREIMRAPKGMDVDHIHHDTLDNRKSEMRLATEQQNVFNRRLHKSNTSGFKGVWWSKACGKWQVSIYIPPKRRHLGYFDSIEDAAAAYRTAAQEQFGDFYDPTNIKRNT
jgi:hypothetical protein